MTYKTLNVDEELLAALVDKMHRRHVGYHLGGKAPSLDCDSSEIHEIDCSGASRYWLHRAAGVTIPDGSANQNKWFADQHFRRVPYSDCSKDDGVIRIAFMRPKNGHGHVVLAWGGFTAESCSGKGVCRQPWTVYKGRMSDCYVLTEGG